jgi:predicted P-loop ATPase
VSRAIVGGIVMRARYPGCKFDLMPIFYGHQGTGKSTAAAILADMGQSSLDALRLGAGMWFTDTVQLGDEAKELVLSLAGKLVAEIGEMGMRNGSNANAVKAMISRQVDAGRTAYARAVTERPRRNIFFGTTNDEHPLTDPSGNRRFLPVAIGAELDLEGLHRDVGQLIGEAAYQESAGRTFDLPREVWELAASRQEDARAIGDLEVYMNEWFKPGAAGYVTVADIVLLCDAVGRKGQGAVVNRIMPRLGFARAKPYLHGHRMDVWVRGEVDRLRAIETLPRFCADLSNSGAPRTVLRTVAGPSK